MPGNFPLSVLTRILVIVLPVFDQFSVVCTMSRSLLAGSSPSGYFIVRFRSLGIRLTPSCWVDLKSAPSQGV